MATIPTIPGYTIERCIGRGGMGAVFLGTQASLGRRVAIKVMLASLLEQDEKFADRFEREARTTASLRHPNVVTVYDSGEFDGRCYMTMDYIEGGSLKDRITAGNLSEEQAHRIAMGICAGLGHAHMAGLVHRDVKPENILLDRTGRPVITDFGIVKVTTSSIELTGTRTVGSPTYMSPEQLMGDRSIDGRADLYSLGVVLFEMLEGRPPFQSDGAYGVGMKHLNMPPPPLSERYAHFQPIVARLLEKNRDKRFGTAAELMVALRRLEAGEALATEPLMPPPPRPIAANSNGETTTARRHADEQITVVRNGNRSPQPASIAASGSPAPSGYRARRPAFRSEHRERRGDGPIRRILSSRLFRAAFLVAIGWLAVNVLKPWFDPGAVGLEWQAFNAKPAQQYQIAMKFSSLGKPERALYWMGQAASGGHPGANYELAVAYRQNDEVRAIAALEAEMDHPYEKAWRLPAQMMLGELLCNGRGIENCQRAQSVLRELAEERGEARAMVRLGDINLAQLSPPDYHAAMGWFRKTLELEDPPGTVASEEAMVQLARMYEEGLGVEPDPQQAARWLVRAAQHPSAKRSTIEAAQLRCADLSPQPAPCRSLAAR